MPYEIIRRQVLPVRQDKIVEISYSDSIPHDRLVELARAEVASRQDNCKVVEDLNLVGLVKEGDRSNPTAIVVGYTSQKISEDSLVIVTEGPVS